MEKQKKQKKKTNIKKVFGGILALALVAVISIVGTLAYLSRTTGNTKVNTFTGSEDIKVGLTEDQWDDKGEEKAEHYTPGLEIEKNPVITNTTTASDGGDYKEWVAIRVDYKVGDVNDALSSVSLSEFTNATSGVVSSFNYDNSGTSTIMTDADFATRGWLKVTPKASTSAKFDIYVYKTPLDKTASTNSLFDSVTVNKNIAKVGTDPNKKYPKFTIDLLGAAVKNEKEFVNGSNGALTELTASNLTYQDPDVTGSSDYIIMNELVKLLTENTTENTAASDSDYLDFSGITP